MLIDACGLDKRSIGTKNGTLLIGLKVTFRITKLNEDSI